MAAMDRDTFIPLGTSIVKLLLLASGQGALATAVGEGAGLLAKFRRTLEIGGNRAVFAEKIAPVCALAMVSARWAVSSAEATRVASVSRCAPAVSNAARADSSSCSARCGLSWREASMDAG